MCVLIDQELEKQLQDQGIENNYVTYLGWPLRQLFNIIFAKIEAQRAEVIFFQLKEYKAS